MQPERIRNEVANADVWLPATMVRQALLRCGSFTPMMLDAVERRAAAGTGNDIRMQRLATFDVFYLAQQLDERLFKPLVRLIEFVDPEQDDERLLPAPLLWASPADHGLPRAGTLVQNSDRSRIVTRDSRSCDLRHWFAGRV